MIPNSYKIGRILGNTTFTKWVFAFIFSIFYTLFGSISLDKFGQKDAAFVATVKWCHTVKYM